MTVELGKIEYVDPRTVWLHEADDSTPWLLANADRSRKHSASTENWRSSGILPI